MRVRVRVRAGGEDAPARDVYLHRIDHARQQEGAAHLVRVKVRVRVRVRVRVSVSVSVSVTVRVRVRVSVRVDHDRREGGAYLANEASEHGALRRVEGGAQQPLAARALQLLVLRVG